MADTSKYLVRNETTGKVDTRSAINTSAGGGDAGKLPCLDGSGLLNLNMMPSGIGPDFQPVAVTSESLLVGDNVNIYLDTVLKARKADASNGRESHGWTKAAVTSPAAVNIYPLGTINDECSGLTIGAPQWLSTTVPGKTQETVPIAGAGVISQFLGYALTATSIKTEYSDPISIPV